MNKKAFHVDYDMITLYYNNLLKTRKINDIIISEFTLEWRQNYEA